MTTLPPKHKIGDNPSFLVNKWYRFAVRRFIKSYRAYHPVRFEGRLLQHGRRDSEHRWSLIRREAEACGARSLLDIGCAEGYFTQRAARELGCFSLGVDFSTQKLTVAQNINTLERNEGVAFMYGHINVASLSCLPKFDIVLFLSVLHHVIRRQGVDYSRELLSAIRSKTRKVMLFDMGGKRRLLEPWGENLPNTGEELSAWIGALLSSAGFSQVDLIGHAAAGKQGWPRLMFREIP